MAIAGAAASAASAVGLSSWFLPMLVAAIAYFHYELMDPESRPIDVVEEMMYDTYDFIIVGAGSAGNSKPSEIQRTKGNNKRSYVTVYCISGAVLANRLSEIEDWNVLLLEAGHDETEISDVPLLAAYLQLSKLDWQYKTEPQPTACLGNSAFLKIYKNVHAFLGCFSNSKSLF